MDIWEQLFYKGKYLVGNTLMKKLNILTYIVLLKKEIYNKNGNVQLFIK